MKRIYIVFEGGGSVEIFMRAFSTRGGAESFAQTSRRLFIIEFVLNEETQEYEEVEG